jgi:uncharacterized membrane protein YtjA (UPF0391 family)
MLNETPVRRRKFPAVDGRRIANRFSMLHWSLIFLIIALIAGILGFTGIAGAAMGIAKILFFVFLVIWLVALLVIRRAV